VSVLDLERWNAASPYLDRALDLDDAGRHALVDALEQTDPPLAADLRALLESHRALLDRRFLEEGSTTSPDLLLAAGQAIGPYELVSPLGQGGMGTVWLAERRDGRFERKVAIKLLNVGLVGLPAGRRFLREGALLAQLRHPNIAELIDAGLLPGGRPYLVLEYVDGEPIDRYCDQQMLGIDERIGVLLRVTSAIEHAHAHLVVHRDLKPANVLVTRDGEVKLLDFGIAKLLAESDRLPQETLTREGGPVLTPAFAAPEQVAGTPVSTATDVYALGVLAYVLLAGRHPGGADLQTPAGMVRSILDTVPPPISTAATDHGGDADTASDVARRRRTSPERLRRVLHGDLDTIVAKALKKNPAERYASVAAFSADLQRYLAHQPISARPDSLGYRARKFVRRNRGAVATSVLTLFAIIAGVAATLIEANIARTQRDLALAQLERAESLNDLNHFLLVDAAPGGKPFTVNSLLEQAERIARRQRSSDTARANLLVSIGGQYASLEEIDESRRVLEQAYETSRRSTVPTVRAQAACGLAETLVLSGEPERARRLVDEGLRELPQAPEYELERASCLLRASRVAREAGSPDDAIRLARAAQEAQSRAPYRSNLLDLRTEMDLAESYNQAGRFGESQIAFQNAATQLAALGRDDTTTAGTLYNNWGLSLNLMGGRSMPCRFFAARSRSAATARTMTRSRPC
jgi:serine/threonine-protein kinase